ncbi:MAG TPA: GWxTD domain-containing protein, partial [Gemmatimonadales bacterium]|nr:GWxTD domain-containing protein [Gemmatimonadales bacterium]
MRSGFRAGVLLAAISSSLGAQSPEQRRGIDSFRDTLLSVTDTLVLREREALLLRSARRMRADAAFHLQLGHIALRQGELGGIRHLDDAASEFRWAAGLEPQWPYAWLGVGYAEYTLGGRLGSRVVPSRDRNLALARDAFSRSAQAFARAVALEAGFASRLEELARRALREGAPEKVNVFREALRRATAGRSRPSRLLLALGRVQREMGDTAALGTFALVVAGNESRAVGLLELGRTQLLQGDLSGAGRYLARAASDDPVAQAEYRADLAPIASESELVEFDRLRGAPRADFLRRFWIGRDRLELRADGERLAEHLRRLRVARREFLVVMPDSSERFDDRGRVYVRHGPPDERASLTVPGVEPNQSWRYRLGGGVVMHFVSRPALPANDYRLVESVLDVSDARERELGRQGIRIGTTSDSYTLRFEPDLDAWGAVLVAGGTGAGPAIQIAFAIPGSAVEPATGVTGVVYPVRVRFIAVDPAGGVIASVDSILRIGPPEPAGADRSVVGRLAVPVRPGRLVAHAAIQYGREAGTEFGIDTITVPAAGAGELELGDLLIGSRRGRIPVPLSDGSELRLEPGSVVHRSDDLDLAVEVFGLPPGGQAGLEVLIAPGPGRGEPRTRRWRPFP